MRALIAVIFLMSVPAFADRNFAAIPAEQTAGRSTGLEMRVVNYNGNVNGVIEVEVRNPTQQEVEFSAKGIYFVPDADPDKAPQRVGAVGPFALKTPGGWKRMEKTTIPAQATVAMKLDVYCIDSHRGSPNPHTAFHVGKERMPSSLVKDIDVEAAKASGEMGGVSAPRAKPAVQSTVWKNRDKKWIRLDGEGKQEANK